MAKKTQSFTSDFAFYEALWRFYSKNRGKIRSRYNNLTKKLLAYNDPSERPGSFLRQPQFEALEMYVFIKEFLSNQQVYEIFDDWRNLKGKFSERSYYSLTEGGQQLLTDAATETQTDSLFKQMRKYNEPYPNYIYALTMGLGKTILMATCIFYEFLLANKYPKDERFVHNALVFAPDKTVLQSLREIVTFEKTLVVPPEYARVLNANVKFHFLEDTGTTLHTLDNSDFNIIISNTQKIVVKKKRTTDTPTETLFSAAKTSSLLGGLYGDLSEDEATDDSTLMENQRFQKITRLHQLGVYVDEAHHLFGANLKKSLHSKTAKKTSLRDTINALAKRTSIVGCYNYTGTPYVDRQPLPEVVYAYGLSESISNGYLKQAHPQAFENVKSEDFLRSSITDFWEKYGEKTYEGLNPKLAIFASTIDEAQNEVRPAVENIISNLGIEPSKVLINVGNEKITKDEDIRLFNDLDTPGTAGNERQFLILVGKGREGWNCRSLFGVAMFRSPKSKVFVLQATMRCLRQITDEQQSASVFLSKENFDILDSELEKNFKMDLDGLGKGLGAERKSFQVRMRSPERTIMLKRIYHEYHLGEVTPPEPLNLGLKKLNDEMYEKYKAVRYEKVSLTSNTSLKEVDITSESQQITYSLFTLVGELSRYLNMSPIQIEKMLRNSVDGTRRILEVVNTYNEVVNDIIVPAIFHSRYEVHKRIHSEDREFVLLRAPKDKEYWEFKAKPELVVKQSTNRLSNLEKAKSFHADTYCFDSKPELECFWQYVESKRVTHVYFTGMFTAKQGDLAIQYYDPQSQRIRSYYPDFVAKMTDGSLRLIEVKRDDKINDELVKAKADAAEEMALESGVDYIMYPGSLIMKTNILQTQTCSDGGVQ